MSNLYLRHHEERTFVSPVADDVPLVLHVCACLPACPRPRLLQAYFSLVLEEQRELWDASADIKAFFFPGPPTSYSAALSRRRSEQLKEVRKRAIRQPGLLPVLSRTWGSMSGFLEGCMYVPRSSGRCVVYSVGGKGEGCNIVCITIGLVTLAAGTFRTSGTGNLKLSAYLPRLRIAPLVVLLFGSPYRVVLALSSYPVLLTRPGTLADLPACLLACVWFLCLFSVAPRDTQTIYRCYFSML